MNGQSVTDVSVRCVSPNFKGHDVQEKTFVLYSMTFQDHKDRLYQKVGNKLQVYIP